MKLDQFSTTLIHLRRGVLSGVKSVAEGLSQRDEGLSGPVMAGSHVRATK